MLNHSITHLYHFTMLLGLLFSRLNFVCPYSIFWNFTFILLLNNGIHATIMNDLKILLLFVALTLSLAFSSLLALSATTLINELTLSVFILFIFIWTWWKWSRGLFVEIVGVLNATRILPIIRLHLIFKLLKTVNSSHFIIIFIIFKNNIKCLRFQLYNLLS